MSPAAGQGSSRSHNLRYYMKKTCIRKISCKDLFVLLNDAIVVIKEDGVKTIRAVSNV